MSIHAPRGAGSDKDAWNAPIRGLRLEKPREISALHDEDRGNQKNLDRRGQKSTRRTAYRFDTTGDLSHWNGPLLTAPFAAQVIGQALDAHEDIATSARRAYRPGMQIGRAFLFDSSI
jgi:hypothetical protein